MRVLNALDVDEDDGEETILNTGVLFESLDVTHQTHLEGKRLLKDGGRGFYIVIFEF